MGRFGSPIQSVLMVGAALAASHVGAVNTQFDSTTNMDPGFDPPRRRGKSANWPHGGGYAKQRREARKRRRRNRH